MSRKIFKVFSVIISLLSVQNIYGVGVNFLGYEGLKASLVGIAQSDTSLESLSDTGSYLTFSNVIKLCAVGGSMYAGYLVWKFYKESLLHKQKYDTLRKQVDAQKKVQSEINQETQTIKKSVTDHNDQIKIVQKDACTVALMQQALNEDLEHVTTAIAKLPGHVSSTHHVISPTSELLRQLTQSSRLKYDDLCAMFSQIQEKLEEQEKTVREKTQILAEQTTKNTQQLDEYHDNLKTYTFKDHKQEINNAFKRILNIENSHTVEHKQFIQAVTHQVVQKALQSAVSNAEVSYPSSALDID